MKKQLMITMAIFTIGLWLPIACLAHHMGQGYGSAPDVVDDYAHGVNAQSDNQSGTNVGMSDEDMGSYGAAGDSDSNGPISSMQGADSYGTGVAGEGSDYAGTGDFGEASAGVGGSGSGGGSGGGDAGNGGGSGGGSGNGNGAGNGRS